MKTPASTQRRAEGAAPTKSPDKLVKVVDRAGALLECVADGGRPLSLAELAARMALPKPTVFRLAAVLTRLELLEQNSAGAYSLGLANLRFAGALLAGLRIRGFARPVMERLRDELNETVVLSLRDGDFRYNIDSVESTRAIGQTQQIGVPIPLYAGAASRVILAAMPSDQREAYIARGSLRSYSETTITDPERLREQIERTRRLGYVVTAGEFTAQSHAVARLIPTPPSLGLSALHVSIPPARYTRTLERRAIAGLQGAVAQIQQLALATA